MPTSLYIKVCIWVMDWVIRTVNVLWITVIREMKPESCLVGGFQSEKKYKPRPAVWVTCDSWSFKYKGRWLERKMIYVQTWRVERSCSGRIKLEGASTSLQGGFPEVTVLNITQECGMLNRCQNKHTGRATATPSDCQGLLYTHMLSCMCTSTEPIK